MSLYDDLGVATSDTKTEGWSKNFKLLQSQLKVKKAALTQAKVVILYVIIKMYNDRRLSYKSAVVIEKHCFADSEDEAVQRFGPSY